MTTAALTAGLERIPDQLGYLVISEDGVLASAGELENDEHTAGVMMQMVRTASRFRLPGSAEPPFKRMSEFWRRLNITDYMELPASHVQLLATHLRRIFSTRVRMSAHRYSDVSRTLQLTAKLPVILEDFVYTVTVSGQKVFVVKRQNNQQEPINV